jgi:hypothetical protein
MSQKRWAKQWLQILRDLLFVLRELWLLLGIHMLALFAFLLMPQGTDMLLTILEPKTFILNALHISLLIVAVFCWSISSEFCTRFLIYMTDNSGHTLSPDRVALRKQNQKSIAVFFLYFPSILVALAFIKAYFQNLSDIISSWWILLLILTAICILVFLLKYLYKADHRNSRPNIFHWMHLSESEKYWTSKLYGIFNDYRVDLHEDEMPFQTQDLPRELLLLNGSFIPSVFQLKKGPTKLKDAKNIRVWMFRIPLVYYRNLITQFLVLVALSILVICFFSFAGTKTYQNVGAIAMICFAFASWQIMYTLLHFLDKAQPIPKINLTFRLLVFVWICFCSYINNDHPARWIEKEKTNTSKKVSEHFNTWITALVASEHYQNADQIPIFFLASEGGALRTGAFTAMLLAKMQDSFPNFKKHIYCYSGISGGSLGLQYFQSLPNSLSHKNENSKITSAFFETDFLSPVTGKLVFGELLNCFFPYHIASFDRAIALETAWELSWAATHKNQENIFAASFNQQIGDNKPAIFINTVESETGLPTVWTNTQLDSTIALYSARDLRNKFRLSIPYSTAINLGTRFPFISPAAMLELNLTNHKKTRLHYIDGGYYENKGQQTLLEIIQAIHIENYPAVKPYIIQFNFSQDDTSNHSIRFANEFMEVMNGIENTRFARASLTVEAMKKYMNKHFDTSQIINLNLDISIKQLPMNWILSHTAMNRIDSYTDAQMYLKKDSLQVQHIFNAIKNIKP